MVTYTETLFLFVTVPVARQQHKLGSFTSVVGCLPSGLSVMAVSVGPVARFSHASVAATTSSRTTRANTLRAKNDMNPRIRRSEEPSTVCAPAASDREDTERDTTRPIRRNSALHSY